MRKAVNFKNSLPARLALVLLAFLLMVVSSCLIMYDTLNSKLLQNAETTMDDTKVYFSRIILEPKAILNLIANNVEGIYNRGEGTGAVKRYITEASMDEFKSQLSVLDYYSVYVYFEHTGEFHDGLGWIPDESYEPKERPWYTAAVEAGGEAAMSELYIDMNTQMPIVSYSRQLFDGHGEPFGVISIDVLIEYLRDLVVNKHITENSYGFMADEKLRIIMHPNTDIEGEPLADSNPDMLRFRGDIESGADISLERTTNYEGMASVIFGRQLDNGWYFTLLIPESEYYGELYDMVVITGALGAVLAGVLMLMLVGIERARRRADEEHKEKATQLAQAEGATRAKSSFLARMSHEIRTPMNAILGITEIQLQNESLDPDVRIALDKIYNASDLLLSIINDILDLSKIEAGKLELVCVNYKIADLISDTVQINMMRLGSKPIEFELFIDENMPASVYGDEMRVRQILNNILSNAFKYTREGTITLSVGIEFSDGGEWKADGGEPRDEVTVVFSVTDTGQGMTQEQVAGLFAEYSRFNQESNRTTEGTGLGLNITQSLVEMMGGSISVESEPGKGSTFTVKIMQGRAGTTVLGKDTIRDLRQFKDTAGRVRMKRLQVVREPMPYGKVLVVDDVETNIYVASGLMLPYGLEIDSADSGPAAISKVESGNVYDIIFMDHMMPVMDGVEAVKHIRAMGYSAPIIALTANAVAGQADMFLKNGFDDFISKPVDVRQLNTALNKWIRDKQPPEVLEAARRGLEGENARGSNGHKSEKDAMARLEVELKIAKALTRDAVKSLPVLEAIADRKGSYGEDELRSYIIHVHGLKSALASIGKQELSDWARRLEMAGREGNQDLIAAETPVFIQDLRNLIEEISPKELVESTELSEGDIAFIRNKLIEVKVACEAFDDEAAEDAIAEIRQEPLPKAVGDVLERILEYLLHSDFEEAANAAQVCADLLPASGSAPLDVSAGPDPGLGIGPDPGPDPGHGARTETSGTAIIIPGLDVQPGLAKFDFNEQMYSKVLRSFADSGRDILRGIRAFSPEALAEYRINVHSIKGMCFDIFADEPARAAERLEKAADAGDADYITENNQVLIDDIESLIINIEKALPDMDERLRKPVKDAPGPGALKRLREACLSFSVDEADAAMREIEKYEYSADGGLAQWLRGKIASLDFDEIAEKLGETFK